MFLPLHPHTDLIAPSASVLSFRVQNALSSLGMQVMAAYLGLTPERLLVDLSEGLSLGQVAADQGRSLAGLRRAVATLAPGALPALRRQLAYAATGIRPTATSAIADAVIATRRHRSDSEIDSGGISTTTSSSGRMMAPRDRAARVTWWPKRSPG